MAELIMHAYICGGVTGWLVVSRQFRKSSKIASTIIYDLREDTAVHLLLLGYSSSILEEVIMDLQLITDI